MNRFAPSGALAGVCPLCCGGDAGPVLLRWLDEKPARPRCREVVARYRPASKCSFRADADNDVAHRKGHPSLCLSSQITTKSSSGSIPTPPPTRCASWPPPLVRRKDQASFPASPAGLDRARTWIAHRAGQQAALVVIEGIGSYGAGLSDRVLTAGFPLAEPSVMGSADRRGVGKTDDLDAARIARSVLSVDIDRLRRPRADGSRVAMRVLVVAREQMTCERTRTINALTALVRTVELGVDARKSLTYSQLKEIAAWRARCEDATTATCRAEAVRLAKRIRALDAELVDNRKSLDALVKTNAPELTAAVGVGAVVAATVLIAWSHAGRVRSEAAFASLAGTCPVPASSGNTVRYRLNRGGDRRLNRALTTVVIVRMRVDPQTRTYVERRRGEGRTTKEIMRSLKRYVTRQLFRTLATAHPILVS